ncbi:MAG: hypothetical protein CVU11_15290 [Bacteroidetes bacterium HGW-Bacteroidetes-6]|jgi:hypothetical protein|nr:MAG: hypothetical protein CVU11_15290 [Bacteroidetes bacterium HGW-Bacteroidetes-6]
MKTKKRIQVIAFIALEAIIGINSFGQKNYEIYEPKNWQPYFKSIGANGDFYFSCSRLLDSLPDGHYTFYSYAQKDSLKKEFSRRIVIGSYLNGQKDGVFKEIEYRYNKKKKQYEIFQVYVAHYARGLLNGYTEEYIVIYHELFTSYMMINYCEYSDGKKNGMEILYNNGYPCKVTIYEKGETSKILMDRGIYPN